MPSGVETSQEIPRFLGMTTTKIIRIITTDGLNRGQKSSIDNLWAKINEHKTNKKYANHYKIRIGCNTIYGNRRK